MKQCLLSTILILISSVVSAETIDDTQVWVPVNINKSFDKNWKGFLEVQPRFGDNISELKTGIIRPAIGYAVNDHVSLWVGYLSQSSQSKSDPNEYDFENRIWQGLTLKDTIGNTKLEARNRFEQRFLSGNSDTEYRWRTRFRGEYLFANTPYSLIGSEEIFINFNDNTVNPAIKSGIEQNRAYVGLGYRFSPEFQVESGYLNQHVWGYSGKADQNNHVWMTNLNINF